MLLLTLIVPVGSVPMKQASIVLPPPSSWIPVIRSENARARTVDPPPDIEIVRPDPVTRPWRIWNSGVPAYPGCVVPSMMTGSEIAGSGAPRSIAKGPGPGMSNAIVSRTPTLAFESVIACRSEPGTPSTAVVTV